MHDCHDVGTPGKVRQQRGLIHTKSFLGPHTFSILRVSEWEVSGKKKNSICMIPHMPSTAWKTTPRPILSQGTWMAIQGSASIKAIGATAYLRLVVLSQVQITRPRGWTLASLTMNHDSRQTYSNESAHRSPMFFHFVDISIGGGFDHKTASTTIHLYEPPKEQTTYIRGHCDSETTENCKGHSTEVYCPLAISSRESAN